MANKLIDLSHTIRNEMDVHPYDDPVNLYQDKFLEKDKYNNFKLEIGMHVGTHLDTPMHLTERKTLVSDIPLERLMGRGCLLDVRNEKVIAFKEKYRQMVNKNDIVLLYTNHSEKYGTKEYYNNHPVVDDELVDFFIKREIKMLGMDLPSPDNFPFEIHKKLFNNDILILENLKNLFRLLDARSFEVMVFPLKIEAEAAPVRVVAAKNIGSEFK